MSKRLVAVAFLSGVLGSVMSHYLWPLPVFAQSSPTEIRARKFVLVNEQGRVLGTFADEANGPALKLFDASGREIWFAGKSPANPPSPNRSFAAVGRWGDLSWSVRDRASFSLQDFRYRAALNQRILDFELMGTAVQRSYSLERMAPKADGEAAFRDHWFSLSNPRGHWSIDRTILEAGGRPGHFGLAGMNERATSIGAKLVVRARLDSGTEVELSVPASVAYRKSPPVVLGNSIWAPRLGMAGLPIQHPETDRYCRKRDLSAVGKWLSSPRMVRKVDLHEDPLAGLVAGAAEEQRRNRLLNLAVCCGRSEAK